MHSVWVQVLSILQKQSSRKSYHINDSKCLAKSLAPFKINKEWTGDFFKKNVIRKKKIYQNRVNRSVSVFILMKQHLMT